MLYKTALSPLVKCFFFQKKTFTDESVIYKSLQGRCRDDPIARHGSRGGTAGVLDRKDSTLTQALARRDLIKSEREIETKF